MIPIYREHLTIAKKCHHSGNDKGNTYSDKDPDIVPINLSTAVPFIEIIISNCVFLFHEMLRGLRDTDIQSLESDLLGCGIISIRMTLTYGRNVVTR